MPATRACPACSTPLPIEAQFCLHCGVATPTDPGVPQRTAATGAFEVAQVTTALAGRYKIEKVLGEGGMATVYLALDQKHKRRVAVKVMRKELSATLGADRFLREVEIAGQLSHPHILPMHDSGEADGLLYYVMPYVKGETLKDRLAREGALPVDDALHLAREVTEALAYAHRQGIVHRDIKPANILLTEGHALVADFGIARALGESGGEELTRTGIAVGTPQYMAPEQAAGDKAVDGRVDIYATGAVLYEMLTGEPPFTGPSARAILTRSLTEKARPLSQVREGVTASLESAVGKALAKDPADRFATGEMMISALDQARATTMSMSGQHSSVRKATEVLSAARTSPPATGIRKWLSLRNGVIAAVAALLIWAVSATVVASRGRAAAAGAPASNRIAVLPFTNQGAEADAYFADGISDEVRGKLARINGLDIIGSSSMTEYKGSSKRPQDIGRELGADYLLVGRVRWAGSEGSRRVQVVPELIDAKTGSVKWQQTFDTDVKDVFEVQSQIATRVAGALGLALAGGEREQLTQRPTQNVQAYQLYLQSRTVQTADVIGTRSQARLLEQAVALDSGFAEAWAALAIANSRIFTNGTREPAAAQRAKEALDRAVALAPQGKLTHLAASRYLTLVKNDQALADAELSLALQAAPNDPEVLSAAAMADAAHRQYDAALAKLERARELDPRTYVTLLRLTQIYAQLGRWSDVETAALAARVLQPNDLTMIQTLARARVAQDRLQEARTGLQAAIDSGVPAAEIAAQFSGRQEEAWMLPPAIRQVTYRLRPSAFENDVAWWGQALATTYWQDGDTVRARLYADSSLAESRKQALETPKDAQLQVLYGLMLAYLRRPAEAREFAKRGLDLNQADSVLVQNTHDYILLNAARIEAALGNADSALSYLEKLVASTPTVPRREIAQDPTWTALRGNPRFEKITQP